MSHYVYVIVNTINLKLYFGSHSWEGEGPDPSYFGSGKLIKRAVEKYGKDNFIIQPIKFYDTVEECRKAEEELLTRYDIANNPYCYNLKNAAVGWTSEDMTGEKHPQYGKRGKDSHNYGRHLSDEHRKKLSENHRAMTGENNHMYGKHHTEETRKKMSEAQKGEKHRLYGKHLSEKTRQKLSQANNYRKIPVVAIQIATGKIRVFEGLRECARKLNLNHSHISKCLNGKCKTHKGYCFKYIEELESGIYEGFNDIAE